MIRTRIVIERVRSVADIYRGRKYRVVARFPGGRTIHKSYAPNRQRAFEGALRANRPQTSPTAAGGDGSYAPGNGNPYAVWKLDDTREDPIFY